MKTTHLHKAKKFGKVVSSKKKMAQRTIMKQRSKRDGIHKDGKKAHPWWATPEEWDEMKRLSEFVGYSSVSGMLKGIANGEVIISRTKTKG